jgi:hypothetical protein
LLGTQSWKDFCKYVQDLFVVLRETFQPRIRSQTGELLLKAFQFCFQQTAEACLSAVDREISKAVFKAW